MSTITAGTPDADCRPSRLRGVLLPMLAVAAMAALSILGESQDHSEVSWLVLDLAVGVLSVLLVPVVLRRPVQGTLALAGLALLSPTAAPAIGLGVLHTAMRRPLRPTLITAGATLAAGAVQGWWRPTSGLAYPWWLAVLAATYAALVGWGRLAQARQALIASLRERAERAEAEQAGKVAQAKQAERTRIAGEMHDVLAHRLSLLSTYAGAVEYRPDASPEQLSKAATVLRATAHQALEDLREVIGVLRAEDTGPESHCRPQPVLADVGRLIQESQEAGVSVQLRGEPPDRCELPLAAGRTAYRVIQEGLTNARKHAAGRPVEVLLGGAPGAGLEVEIRNPLGTAPATTPGSGTGLVGLTERVQLSGGTLRYGPDAAGFRLHAWLPWPPA